MTKQELFRKLDQISDTCDYTDEFDFHLMEGLLDYIGEEDIKDFITQQYSKIINNRQRKIAKT